MYHRFELYVGDEYQGCGIFQGMSELDCSDDAFEKLTQPFDVLLNIPLDVYAKNKNTEAWFTEDGFNLFESAINTIIEAYDATGLWEVKHRIEDIPKENILYSDEYQIICK